MILVLYQALQIWENVFEIQSIKERCSTVTGDMHGSGKYTPCVSLIDHAAERLYPKHQPPTQARTCEKQGKL